MPNATRIRMARKPGEKIVNEDFKSEIIQLPTLGDGEVICKTRYISLDPYLSGLMQSWQGPQRDWSEGIIVGRKVGQIVESNDPNLATGDWVIGDSRWQNVEVNKGKQLQKIQIENNVPASAYLGVLGSSGLTAWVGIHRVLDIKAGETLTISSAAGTVANVAGQLAMQCGAKVIGIAGGQEKCAQVVARQGFSACVDHHASDLAEQLATAVGDGIDAHYENVGAKTLDPALGLMKDGGRIALCGLIAHYLNDDAISLRNFRKLLTAGLTLKGFRVYDYLSDVQQAQTDLLAGVKAGTIGIYETITEGLENAPSAYVSMLNSGGMGKHLIHIGD